MKVIDAHLVQKSMYGTADLASVASTNSPWHRMAAPSWCLFGMGGNMPDDEAAIAQLFDTNSLASLYNASIGFGSSVLSQPADNLTISQRPQLPYVPKGYAKYNETLAYCMPDSVSGTRTDRDIQFIIGGETALFYDGIRFCAQDVTLEWNTPVNLYGFLLAFPYSATMLIYVDGVAKPWDLDGNIAKLRAPVTGQTVRLVFNNNVNSVRPLTTDAPIGTLEVPKWGILAPNNTVTVFDQEFSASIPFLADAISDSENNIAPYYIFEQDRTKNITLFCDNFRFNNRVTS